MPIEPPDTATLTAMPELYQPAVIPTNIDWRSHPRWKPLITTPDKTTGPTDTFVPDPSPTRSPWSDGESDNLSQDSPIGSFVHRRRYKEYIHRAPVLFLQELSNLHSDRIDKDQKSDMGDCAGYETPSTRKPSYSSGEINYQNQENVNIYSTTSSIQSSKPTDASIFNQLSGSAGRSQKAIRNYSLPWLNTNVADLAFTNQLHQMGPTFAQSPIIVNMMRSDEIQAPEPGGTIEKTNSWSIGDDNTVTKAIEKTSFWPVDQDGKVEMLLYAQSDPPVNKTTDSGTTIANQAKSSILTRTLSHNTIIKVEASAGGSHEQAAGGGEGIQDRDTRPYPNPQATPPPPLPAPSKTIRNRALDSQLKRLGVSREIVIPEPNSGLRNEMSVGLGEEAQQSVSAQNPTSPPKGQTNRSLCPYEQEQDTKLSNTVTVPEKEASGHTTETPTNGQHDDPRPSQAASQAVLGSGNSTSDFNNISTNLRPISGTSFSLSEMDQLTHESWGVEQSRIVAGSTIICVQDHHSDAPQESMKFGEVFVVFDTFKGFAACKKLTASAYQHPTGEDPRSASTFPECTIETKARIYTQKARLRGDNVLVTTKKAIRLEFFADCVARTRPNTTASTAFPPRTTLFDQGHEEGNSRVTLNINTDDEALPATALARQTPNDSQGNGTPSHAENGENSKANGIDPNKGRGLSTVTTVLTTEMDHETLDNDEAASERSKHKADSSVRETVRGCRKTLRKITQKVMGTISRESRMGQQDPSENAVSSANQEVKDRRSKRFWRSVGLEKKQKRKSIPEFEGQGETGATNDALRIGIGDGANEDEDRAPLMDTTNAQGPSIAIPLQGNTERDVRNADHALLGDPTNAQGSASSWVSSTPSGEARSLTAGEGAPPQLRLRHPNPARLENAGQGSDTLTVFPEPIFVMEGCTGESV
ncbi:MAG: hypothetical protein M1827_000734 [Pycnora praestabilis]|nr:MAG: hypothetical protein M1827_000734 [Pycnora praestabilis]